MVNDQITSYLRLPIRTLLPPAPASSGPPACPCSSVQRPSCCMPVLLLSCRFGPRATKAPATAHLPAASVGPPASSGECGPPGACPFCCTSVRGVRRFWPRPLLPIAWSGAQRPYWLLLLAHIAASLLLRFASVELGLGPYERTATAHGIAPSARAWRMQALATR